MIAATRLGLGCAQEDIEPPCLKLPQASMEVMGRTSVKDVSYGDVGACASHLAPALQQADIAVHHRHALREAIGCHGLQRPCTTPDLRAGRSHSPDAASRTKHALPEITMPLLKHLVDAIQDLA